MGRAARQQPYTSMVRTRFAELRRGVSEDDVFVQRAVARGEFEGENSSHRTRNEDFQGRLTRRDSGRGGNRTRPNRFPWTSDQIRRTWVVKEVIAESRAGCRLDLQVQTEGRVGWRSVGSLDLPPGQHPWREDLRSGAQQLREDTNVKANGVHYDAK